MGFDQQNLRITENGFRHIEGNQAGTNYEQFDGAKLIAAAEKQHLELLRRAAIECAKPVDLSTAKPRLPETQNDHGARLAGAALTIKELQETQRIFLEKLAAIQAQFDAVKAGVSGRNR